MGKRCRDSEKSIFVSFPSYLAGSIPTYTCFCSENFCHLFLLYFSLEMVGRREVGGETNGRCMVCKLRYRTLCCSQRTNNRKCCCYPCKLHMKVVFSHHIYMYLATHIIILSPSCLYILCYTTWPWKWLSSILGVSCCLYYTIVTCLNSKQVLLS